MDKLFFSNALILFFSLNGFSQNWLTSFTNAKNEALQKNQNIVFAFQGSDWCALFIKLDKEIWSTKEFQDLAKNHFIMLKVDFPRKKANKLSEELTLQT